MVLIVVWGNLPAGLIKTYQETYERMELLQVLRFGLTSLLGDI